MINDNNIQKASQHVHEILLHITSITNEPPHTFSKEFEDKIKSLFPRTFLITNSDEVTRTTTVSPEPKSE